MIDWFNLPRVDWVIRVEDHTGAGFETSDPREFWYDQTDEILRFDFKFMVVEYRSIALVQWAANQLSKLDDETLTMYVRLGSPYYYLSKVSLYSHSFIGHGMGRLHTTKLVARGGRIPFGVAY